ncbi:MAG: sodium:solute symporter [candidate division NC10 bacterium]|nr:sodium:solute symporter [candidate division NC10 bacterium]
MNWLWMVLVGYGFAMLVFSPRSRDAKGFYWGHDRRGREAGVWLLSASTLITWIFAKSVTNAANLGAAFGLVGGLAYAGYYLSIPVAGIVIASIRKRHRVSSLAEYLVNTYGRAATLAFLLVVFIRLFNEVWSNTAVIGAYFGDRGTFPYFAAAFLFTGFTLLYSLKGGMRSSLITDAIQLGLAAFLLFLALGQVLPRTGLRPILTAGEFSLRGGVDLLLVALLQSLSYPFHDPVLTDRGFLTERRAMRKAFLFAGLGGAAFILLASWIGIYAYLHRIPFSDDSPRAVAQAFGLASLVVMNVIMLSSAGSTLDSTLTSFSKGAGIDVAALNPRLVRIDEAGKVRLGKAVMVIMAVAGNLPLLAGPSILKATTLSGTMVMGLAPIFLFHFLKGVPVLSFHLALWPGIILGTLHAFGMVPAFLTIGSGKYAGLLGVNLYGLILCTGLYLLPVAAKAVAQRRAGISLALQGVRQ